MAGAIPDDWRQALQDPVTASDPQSAVPAQGIGLMDYARQLAASSYGAAGSVLGGLEYLDNPESTENAWARARGWTEAGAKAQTEAMSPEAQRNLAAGVLPNGDQETIWDRGISTTHALGLRAVGGIPSLAATVAPALIGGPVGLAASMAVGASMTSGDTYSDIKKAVVDHPDAKLQEINPAYRGLRSMGVDEAQAKQTIADESAGYLPAYMGAVTALTSKFGIENIVAKRAAGEALGSVLHRTGMGAASESSQEFVENYVQEILTQKGIASAENREVDHDHRKALTKAVEGALVGGITGGALGATLHGGHGIHTTAPEVRTTAVVSDVDPTIAATAPAATQEAAQPVPEVAPTPVAAVEPKRPGAPEPATPGATTTTAAPAVAEVAPTTQASIQETVPPEVQVALPQEATAPAEVSSVPVAAPEVAPVVNPAAVEQVATPVTPEVTPVAEVQQTAPALEQPFVPGVGDKRALSSRSMGARRGNKAEAEAALAAYDAARATPTAEPTPTAPRVLEDTASVAKVKQSTDRRHAYFTPAEADAVVKGERQVLSLPTDPEKFGSKADRESVGRHVERLSAAAQKAGVELDPVWKEIGELKGTVATSNRKRWMELRQQLHDRQVEATKAKVEADAQRIAPSKEAREKERAEKRGASDEAGRAVLNDVTPAADLVEKQDFKGMQEYINNFVAEAEKRGLKTNARGDMADELLHIANAKKLAGKSGTRLQKAGKQKLLDFMVSDAALRAGGKGVVREFRKSQQLKKGLSLDENLVDKKETSEGASAGAVTNVTEEAVVEGLDAGGPMQEPLAQEVRGPSTPQRQIVVEKGPVVVAGADRAGKFVKVEGRQRLKVKVSPEAVQKIQLNKKVAKTDEEAKAAAVAEHVREAQDVTPVAMRSELDEHFGIQVDDVEDVQPLKGLIEDPNLYKNASPFFKILAGQVRSSVRRLVGDVPVRSLDDKRFEKLYRARYPKGEDMTTALGFYDPNAHDIIIRASKMGSNDTISHTVMHEGIHAAFWTAIRARPKLREHVEGLMRTVEAQWQKETRGQVNPERPYGLTHFDEFVAEAFSNPEFQELLTRTPALRTDVSRSNAFKRLGARAASVWGQFIDAVGQALGRTGTKHVTVLDEIIRNVAQLDEGATFFREKFGSTHYKAVQSGIEAAAPAPLRVSRETLQDVRDIGGDRLHAFNDRRRLVGLKLATLDQIERVFRPVFDRLGSTALKDYIAAKNAQANWARGKARDALDVAKELQALGRKHPDAMHTAGPMLITMQIHELDNPDNSNSHLFKKDGTPRQRHVQAVAALEEVRQQWATLPEEIKDGIVKLSEFYKTTENATRVSHIAAILRADANAYTPQQYNDIMRHTLDGNFNEAFHDTVGNEALAKALEYSGFQRIKGMYVPLKRYGDHVVRSWQRIGDTFGGKVVKEDQGATITWEGPDAKENYEKFAKSNPTDGPKITSQVIDRYVDGVKVSTEEAKMHDNVKEVYRARVHTQRVDFFESLSAARRFIRESAEQFADIDKAPLRRADIEHDASMTNGQINTLIKSLEQNPNVSKQYIAAMKPILAQAALRSLPGSHVLKHSLPRSGIYGASTNLVRGLINYANADANYHAKVKYAPDTHEAMNALRAEIPKGRGAGKDEQAINNLLTEIEAREKGNPNDRGPVMRNIMALSFMDKLFSPAYSVINALQPVMNTLPVLGGRYGNAKTATALMQMYNLVGGRTNIMEGLKNTKRAFTTDLKMNEIEILKNVKKRIEDSNHPMKAQFLQVIDHLEKNGFDVDQGMEISGSVGKGGGRFTRGVAIADRIARQLPAAVEANNRLVSALAAYQLYMTNEPAQTKSHLKGLEFANDVVNQTQFNYDAHNAPRFMTNKYLGPAFQFKKYAQAQYALLYDLSSRALGPGVDPKERRVAGKQLLNVVGMQMLMAGAMGLPGLELLKTGMMVASVFGLGSGYDDWERKMRKLMDESFGKTWGELLSRGILTRAARVDVSSRMSLSDLAFFGEPKSTDAEGINAYFGRLLGGAPLGLALDWAGAIKKAGEGDFKGALIDAIPNKMVSDIGKGIRGRYSEGNMSTGEMILQGVGFRSARLAEKGYETGGSIAQKKSVEEQLKVLRRKYLSAETTSAERIKLKAEMSALRKKSPSVRLDDIVAKRAKERRELIGD